VNSWQLDKEATLTPRLLDHRPRLLHARNIFDGCAPDRMDHSYSLSSISFLSTRSEAFRAGGSCELSVLRYCEGLANQRPLFPELPHNTRANPRLLLSTCPVLDKAPCSTTGTRMFHLSQLACVIAIYHG
jgi:hypothetical protein